MASVLLVDDSPTLLFTLSQVLSRAGYAITTAKDGSTALSHLHKGAFDLIITDLSMPGMDGIELVAEIRKLGAYRTKPVLLLSAESQAEKRQQARAAGATGWLVKPVGAAALLEVVQKVLAA